MKFLKITAAILSLALLTACNSAQSVYTSGTVSESEMSAVTTAAETTAKTETQTEAPAITTTAAETETEQSADDISEADKDLLKILTDEMRLPEEVLLEYAWKIDDFEGFQRGYTADGVYDFNGDGIPEIYVGGWDMITPYAAVYDISKGDPEYIFGITTAAIYSTDLFDGIIYLFYDRKEDQYFYYAMTSYLTGGAAIEDTIMYIIEQSRIDVDLENHILGEKQHSQESFSNENEWKAACEKAEKELCNCALIDKLYTLDEPYLYTEEGSYGLRLLHSYCRSNSRRRLAMLLNETGVSGLTFNMSPDEVKKIFGEPNKAFDDSIIFKAETWVYDTGNFTFIDKAEDGDYRLASMWRLNSFNFCGITEKSSRSELISALKDMGIYPEANFDFYSESETLENTDMITVGNPKGLNIIFKINGDNIEYMSTQFVALT